MLDADVVLEIPPSIGDGDDFPLPGLLGQIQRKEFTFGDWVLHRQAKEREPFQPHWDEAMRRVAAGEFSTLKALAAAYGKQPDWAARLRDVAIGQRVFSAVSWKACFSGKRKPPIEPLTAQPSQQGGTPPLTRAQFEAVFREKQEDGLTFDLAVQLMRLGCWSSAREFAGHFRKPVRWAQAFRRFLMREGTITAKEWRACWERGRRKGPRKPCNTTTGTASFKP
ncbi:MAG: hypothetical protein A4E20_03805 [Nitrospira sp. SG-bin2]|uniref:hypothetical protein n=1 Tax=Nitrospira cf. moscoviensis SBR1015 TaxID=96242 RepID=UPI000A099584|nr:hypothetical protein [Nitrospira cf. moscoviensis SBR1015]OQW31419.1 MAG: hypothetical protein A4E20_03805 [Nitrospira sp. SG-bin2]